MYFFKANRKPKIYMQESMIVLGIESSCDDTSAAIIKDGILLSNIIAGQDIHKKYGGVVPELASRAHQQNIIPVVHHAIKKAGISKNDITCVAFTRGPGLLGSLLVGVSFAKAFALAQNIPMIEVNHLNGHVMALFINSKNEKPHQPNFPFLCLTVSGGHTHLSIVKSHLEEKIIGKTIDDAAGEAFDKTAKLLGLPYPGGPTIDKYAQKGNPLAFAFAKPNISNLNFSFSGLKTSILYFLQKQIKSNPLFIQENIYDICASVQHAITSVLLEKLIKAQKQTELTEIGLSGGVSANSGLRKAITDYFGNNNVNVFFPKLQYTTDNAAMIALTGYYKCLNNEFCKQNIMPFTKLTKA